MGPKAESSTIKEGRTILLIPKLSVEAEVPPRSPAFFNPRAKLSRDVSMLVYSIAAKEASKPVTMADGLAGVGARGIRVAVEVPEVDRVYINDINPTAVRYAKASARLNGVWDKCIFKTMDVCEFLITQASKGERFHIIDIDPFGSPAPYIECALRAIRDDGLLSVTATDTPVLCGIYPKVAYRKYFGYSLKVEYCHELAIRLLIAGLARTAMKLDLGILPIFSHSTQHYVRVYVKASAGAAKAEASMDQLGYMVHCFKCGHRKMAEHPTERCDECGSLAKFAGPLWLGELYDKRALDELITISDGTLRKLFRRAKEELGMPPSYYVLDVVADELQVGSVGPDRLVEALRREGYRATRTAINPRAVKSDAPMKAVKSMVKKLAGSHSPR